LETLQAELSGQTHIRRMDVSQPEEAVSVLTDLVNAMGGLDLLIFCSGTGQLNPGLEWLPERDTIRVNVSGFTALACAAMTLFIRQGFGHIAAISSVAALRGSAECPAYNASKAYMSNYLEGLRCKAAAYGKRITVTDIKPGFVDTAMAQGDGLFWVAPAEKAARQIHRILARRKPGGYVTKRWGLVACVFKLLPRRLYAALSAGSGQGSVPKE
jgi:short-subunit dehydrogenase